MNAGTVATAGAASVPDDEWFGEGSAFDSGEDLAAALFALAGTTHTDPAAESEVVWPAPVPPADQMFEEMARPAALVEARRPGSPPARARPASALPVSWSVRVPGVQLLPPKVAGGRSGWTIRNSVAVLHRTEDAIARLREEAVAMAFLAAAEACGRGRPASLERRSHPR